MPVMSHIRRAITARPTFAEKATRTVLAVLIPTLLRWVLVGDYYGAPFVLYFPAILMIAVLIGWRSGAVTALGSAIVGVLMFWPTDFIMAFGAQHAIILVMYVFSSGCMIGIGQVLRDAVLEIEAQARQSEAFNQELQHRTKNSIQMMRALASQASKATDPAEFYETLGGRLAALAKANELLRFGALEACRLDALMRAAVAPFSPARISFGGPPCRVSRNGCTPLMMALHELGTNATKYGALSNDSGRVDISWRLREGDGPEGGGPEGGGPEGDWPVEIVWRESGGPPVSEPVRRGIGARLLSPNGDMRRVEIQYLPDGVICEMSVAQA